MSKIQVSRIQGHFCLPKKIVESRIRDYPHEGCKFCADGMGANVDITREHMDLVNDDLDRIRALTDEEVAEICRVAAEKRAAARNDGEGPIT